MAVLGLAKPIKDLAFQLEFTSLAHLVQKLTAYEHYHPELYQDKFKRHVNMAQAEESDDSDEEQEVVVVEWTLLYLFCLFATKSIASCLVLQFRTFILVFCMPFVR